MSVYSSAGIYTLNSNEITSLFFPVHPKLRNAQSQRRSPFSCERGGGWWAGWEVGRMEGGTACCPGQPSRMLQPLGEDT